jgi:DTW domain-containing protein YfiP/predicted N-acetyltransferase YhbS
MTAALLLVALACAPDGCSLHRVGRSQLAAVNAFYRSEGDRGRARASEAVFVLRAGPPAGSALSGEALIVGAVRLEPRKTGPAGQELLFLRSLCIARSRQRRGLGTWLASASTTAAGLPCYCFAYAHLTSLYASAGFSAVPRQEAPVGMASHFDIIQARESRHGRSLVCMLRAGAAELALLPAAAPSLRALVHSSSIAADPAASLAAAYPPSHLPSSLPSSHLFTPLVSLILLQHSNEARRPTGTGLLLSHPALAPHLSVSTYSWCGRADNPRIDAVLAAAGPALVLLWADNQPSQARDGTAGSGPRVFRDDEQPPQAWDETARAPPTAHLFQDDGQPPDEEAGRGWQRGGAAAAGAQRATERGGAPCETGGGNAYSAWETGDEYSAVHATDVSAAKEAGERYSRSTEGEVGSAGETSNQPSRAGSADGWGGDGRSDLLPPTYILLDGTWQEARAMYRKGPARLREVRRLALAPTRPSIYVLRRDRGWRSRFGGVGGGCGGELLCTAECAAELLEAVAADTVGGGTLRRLLGEFQRRYEAGRSGGGAVGDGTSALGVGRIGRDAEPDD